MSTIRVNITRTVPTGIETIDLEEYLYGVVPSEMGTGWPVEALKAQAIASRSVAVFRIKPSKPYDVTDTTADQAYVPSKIKPDTTKAVKDTSGLVLLYNGKVIDAVFSASNGGTTVSAKERWGGSGYPYLIAGNDPYDKKAGYKKNGHGVGMSQRGAQQMAKDGMLYTDILKFYYPGTIVGKIPASSTASAQRTLRSGDRGDDVKTLQEKLALNGHYPGKADGIFGKNTEIAVKTFQRVKNLTVDGIAGKDTFKALGM